MIARTLYRRGSACIASIDSFELLVESNCSLTVRCVWEINLDEESNSNSLQRVNGFACLFIGAAEAAVIAAPTTRILLNETIMKENLTV